MLNKMLRVICLAGCLALTALAAQPALANYLANGDFENSTVTWNPTLSRTGSTATYSFYRSSAQSHSGSYSACIDAYNGSGVAYVENNEEKYEQLWVHVDSASMSSLAPGTMVLIRFYVKTIGLTFKNSSVGRLTYAVSANDSNGLPVNYATRTCSLRGTSDGWMELSTYYRIPSTGISSMMLNLMLVTGISSGSIYFDDVSIDTVNIGSPRSDAILSQVSVDTGGTPRLKLNGTATAPVFFMASNDRNWPVVFDEIAQAADAGVNLVQVSVSPTWDFFSVGLIEQALRANPNAKLLLRVHLEDPRNWHAVYAAGQGYEMVNSDNSLAYWGDSSNVRMSFAADVYFNMLKTCLTDMIAIIHNGDASDASDRDYKDEVIGYQLACSEWFLDNIAMADHFQDYCYANLAKYRIWLATKYVNISSLNANWNTSYSSFSSVALPTINQWQASSDGFFRNPAVSTQMADYCEFYNNQVADRIIELASWIKTQTSSRSLTAAFYGYHNELVYNGVNNGIGHSGHLGLRRLLASSALDIVCSPFSYYDRGLDGPGNFMSAVDSITRAGKLALQENDMRTYAYYPLDQPAWFFPTPNETRAALRRDMGNVVVHNLATWFADLPGTGSFDDNNPNSGGVSLWDNNEKCVETYNDCVSNAVAISPQIAVIYDEDSYFWLKSDCYALTAPNSIDYRSVFQSCGAQVGYYHIEDVPYLPSSVKLIVFNNTWRVSSSDMTLINQAKSNGRTLLWMYAPGYVADSALSLSNMATLTGLPLSRLSSLSNVRLTIASSGYHITDGLVGHVVSAYDSPTLAPVFYGTSGGSYVTLGTYTGTSYPAMIMKENSTWRSIFCGMPELDVPTVRAIARYAGVNLLVDGDVLDRDDAITMNSRYFYAYSPSLTAQSGSSAVRVFNLPCEEIPNGSFERFTGSLPTSGFNNWVSPYFGSITCNVNLGGYVGNNGCHTWGFNNGSGVYNVPLGIDVALEEGKTYEVSCWVWVRDLVTANAGASDYIYITVSPYAWNSYSRAFPIAVGTTNYMTPITWTHFTTTYTHYKYSAQQPQMMFLLKMYGNYSASDIIIDHVSVREQGTSTVGTVQNYMTNTNYLHGVTSWSDTLTYNPSAGDAHQKIYALYP